MKLCEVNEKIKEELKNNKDKLKPNCKVWLKMEVKSKYRVVSAKKEKKKKRTKC